MIPPQRNADFAAGMEKVLDVYRRPYDAGLPRRLHGRDTEAVDRRDAHTGPRRRRDGRPARTTSIDGAAPAPCSWPPNRWPGGACTKVTERRTKKDWARFLHDIAGRYPDATRITLVMDNLNTHRPGALYETFEPARAKALWDRFEFVFTPSTAVG